MYAMFTQVVYTPTHAGDYLITVKYGGNFHIVGSPWRVHIGGQPAGDSSQVEHAQATVKTTTKTAGGKSGARLVRVKDSRPENVVCKGMGLKRAFMGKMAQFTVETNTAGMDTGGCCCWMLALLLECLL